MPLPVGFVTQQQVYDQLHDILQRARCEAGELKAFWQSITGAATGAALGDIYSALTMRGYSVDQIAQWDRGAEFQMAIAIWWCLEHGLLMDTASYNPSALDEWRLDRRWELYKTERGPGVTFTINGAFVDPKLLVGQAVSGTYDTSNDEFVYCPRNTGRAMRL